MASNKSKIQPGALVSLNDNYIRREYNRPQSQFTGGEVASLSPFERMAIVQRRDRFGRLELFFLSEVARRMFDANKTYRASSRLGPDGYWRNFFELFEVDLLAE